MSHNFVSKRYHPWDNARKDLGKIKQVKKSTLPLYRKDYEDKEGSTSLTFVLPEKIGILAEALKVFEEHKVTLHHIESRPAKDDPNGFEFFVACDNMTGGLKEAINDLRNMTKTLTVLSRNPDKDEAADADAATFPKLL